LLSSRLAVFDPRRGLAPVVQRREANRVPRGGTRAPHEKRVISASVRQWALVVAATLLVAVCPVAVVWWLRASETITSPVLGVTLGMVLSLCASQLGRVLWEKRPGSEDLLFSELMLWGYLHRRHTQRRLASAIDMLAPMSGGQEASLHGLSTRQQAALLERLVAGIETRDPYLHGHSRRVARHSWMIARRMGLSRAEVARIRTAAAIHDVGKIQTPKTILHKAGPLTPEEYEVIKRHPGAGASMAGALGDAELTALVLHHHERLDGTGYPSALSGEEIPLGARIIAVADTFDAITSARPYRAASPHKKALDILRAEAGTRLDPDVVHAFCSHYAGRRPIALWATVTGLPERALSWVGGSAGSVASAVKVVAVAALVGGTAVTSSSFALPPAKHDSQVAYRSLAEGARGSGAQAPATGRAELNAASSLARTQRSARARAVLARAAGAAPALRTLASVAGAQTAQTATSSGVSSGSSSGSGAGQGSEVASAHVIDNKQVTAAAEAPGAKSTAEAVHTKTQESAASTKSEEAHAKAGEPAHGKSEEAHGKKEEPHGKSEEAHGKSEEPHGKSEEAHGKKEEQHGKSEEAHGKSEEPHGKSEEAHGKSEEPHGKSEEAHGDSEEAHGKSDESHGKSDEAHGHG
jgi:HD domain-containing protein